MGVPFTLHGRLIARLREARGYTQEQLAVRAGLTASTIRAYEQGRHGAQPAKVAKLAAALGVTVDDLYGVIRVREDDEETESQAVLV